MAYFSQQYSNGLFLATDNLSVMKLEDLDVPWSLWVESRRLGKFGREGDMESYFRRFLRKYFSWENYR